VPAEARLRSPIGGCLETPSCSSPSTGYNSGMLRPDRLSMRMHGESCCIRLAGESPVAVGAEAPCSRSQATGENLASERDIESP
jgi:hypothetical protein